jgi:biopolymer transport protein ExbB/TolQ
MIQQLQSAMISAGTLWVLVLMIVLSVVSLAIMFERAWTYWSLRDDVGQVITDLGKFLRDGDLAGAKKRLEASPSAEAAVVVAGIIEAPHGVEAAEEAMAGASALQRLKLEKRLSFLGTLGNNAPFIGLLGTVIGILSAFDELGHKDKLKVAGAAAAGLAPEGVMLKISEALVATGVGLFIAIPAVAAFNAFSRIVKGTLANTDAMGHVLLAHLKSNDFDAAAAKHALAGAAKKEASSAKADTAKKSSDKSDVKAASKTAAADDAESEK